MSRVSVAVSVVTAALLTVIAAALYRTPPADARADAPVVLIPFDARQAHTLEIVRGSRVAAARRAGRSLDWWITIDDGDVRRAWPASQQSVRGALRLLAEIQPQSAEADAFTPAGAIVIRTDDDEFSAQLADHTFAGRGLIRPIGVEDVRLYSVNSALHDLALHPGPAAWRDVLAFSDVQRDSVVRIGLSTRSESILLARVQGQWYVHPGADLEQPGLRAGKGAVDDLLRTIGATRVDQFIDEPLEGDVTGLDDPGAVLTIQSAYRLDSGERRTRLRELRIGRTTSVGAQSLYALLDDTGAAEAAGDAYSYEPQLVAIDAGALAGLSMSAASYLDPRAVPAPEADVGQIIVSDLESQPLLVATRTLDGWRLEGGAVPSQAEAAAVSELLALACTTEGQGVLRDDVELQSVCTIELRDIGDRLIAQLTLGVGAAADGSSRPVLADERTARIYNADAADAIIDWLTP